MNEDAKLDMLIGDAFSLSYPLDGVSKKATQERLAAWEKEMNALRNEMPDVAWPETSGDEMSPQDRKAMKAFDAKMKSLETKRRALIRENSTGAVWLHKRK